MRGDDEVSYSTNEFDYCSEMTLQEVISALARCIVSNRISDKDYDLLYDLIYQNITMVVKEADNLHIDTGGKE